VERFNVTTVLMRISLSKDSRSLAEKLKKEIRNRWEDVSIGWYPSKRQRSCYQAFWRARIPTGTGHHPSHRALAEALKLIELLRDRLSRCLRFQPPEWRDRSGWRTGRHGFIVGVGKQNQLCGAVGDEKINGSAVLEIPAFQVIENLRTYRQ
jgi:hypothetical protein